MGGQEFSLASSKISFTSPPVHEIFNKLESSSALIFIKVLHATSAISSSSPQSNPAATIAS